MADNRTQINLSPESRLPELVVVYNNNTCENHLHTTHGFSCLIRLARRTILFDTGGDSSTLLYNMKQLEIDPDEVDDVFLSHINSDHTGGLSGFLKQNSSVTVYLPQSFPKGFKDEITSAGVQVEETCVAQELFTGVYTTGELGGGIIEQSLVLKTGQGLVVVTGCAHPGIVEIICKPKKLFLAAGCIWLLAASIYQGHP